MKNQLATKEESPAPSLPTVLQTFTDLAMNPDVDPAKLQAIADFQRGVMKDLREQDYAIAMAAARKEMPTIEKTGAITNRSGQVQSRYAHFEAIDQIVRPIANKFDLDYGFNLEQGANGQLMVTCQVTHIGQSGAITVSYGPMPLAVDTTGSKNATQGAGSASSYGKRYTLCAAFNIITKGSDTDGQNTQSNVPTVFDGKFQTILDGAQRAAAAGSETYAAYFKSQSNMARGWLVDEGHHENLKRAAESQ